MKVEQIEPQVQFRPIVITLETQEEVDTVFTAATHSILTDILPALKGLWKMLQPFRSLDYQSLFNRLDKRIS